MMFVGPPWRVTEGRTLNIPGQVCPLMTMGQPQLGVHHRCDTRFPPTCGAFGPQGSAGSSQSSWVTIEKNDGVGSTHSPSLPADWWLDETMALASKP